MGFALLSEKWMIVLLSKDHEEEGISIFKLRVEQRSQRMKDRMKFCEWVSTESSF